ncbi:S8 family serine peptidase [Alistipes shahii]|uniref:S8 family serine peptidase n=1 Tax=Alistipes shahii TaxID=328814 RepID=UPI00293D3823|nr:S8 family serine peptidase [Alistipes shahii]
MEKFSQSFAMIRSLPLVRRTLLLSVCGLFLFSGRLFAGNPLLVPSEAPYGAPRFDRIHAADIMPAIEEGIRAYKAGIAKIRALDPAEATFENVVVPLDRADSLLDVPRAVLGYLKSNFGGDSVIRISLESAQLTGEAYDAVTLSWGSSVKYQVIDDAISNALRNGRSGKGCVVVFASGNDYQSTVGYPANCNPEVIAVGAISSSGMRASFSNYGSALDVVAPGEDVITTTTNSGYSSAISGTSFACPLVAGVAALVLSVNPDLTQKQVADIIESTAKKCGNYSYTTQSGHTNGTWNNQMGYGLVDAYAAVIKAKNTGSTVYFNDKTVTTDTVISGDEISATNVTVKNNAKLTFTNAKSIIITQPFTVELTSSLELSLQ